MTTTRSPRTWMHSSGKRSSVTSRSWAFSMGGGEVARYIAATGTERIARRSSLPLFRRSC